MGDIGAGGVVVDTQGTSVAVCWICGVSVWTVVGRPDGKEVVEHITFWLS